MTTYSFQGIYTENTDSSSPDPYFATLNFVHPNDTGPFTLFRSSYYSSSEPIDRISLDGAQLDIRSGEDFFLDISRQHVSFVNFNIGQRWGVALYIFGGSGRDSWDGLFFLGGLSMDDYLNASRSPEFTFENHFRWRDREVDVNIFSEVSISENDFFNGQGAFGAGDDYIWSEARESTSYGEGGSDELRGNRYQDTLYGGQGADILRGTGDEDELFGGAGRDQLFGGIDNDILKGGANNDLLRGGDGVDLLYGGGDRDEIHGGAETDSLYGGKGDDTLYGGDELDFVNGGAGSDTIYGDDGDDYLFGEQGEQQSGRIRYYPVWSKDGAADEIYGGTGHDSIWGGAGDDRILDPDLATIYGGAGEDLIELFDGSAYGGAGDDLIETLTGEAYGGQGDDMLRATGDLGLHYAGLSGGPGRDTLWSRDARATSVGGDGADTITMGDAEDRAFGGAGRDVIRGGGGRDSIDGGRGADQIYGGDGADILYATEDDHRERLEDTPWANPINGKGVIYGGAGFDQIYGDNSRDWLFGGLQADFIYGGDGNDHLIDGPNGDRLYGERGADHLYLVDDGVADSIYNFNPDEDLIYLETGGYDDLTFETIKTDEIKITRASAPQDSIKLRYYEQAPDLDTLGEDVFVFGAFVWPDFIEF